MDMNQNHEKIVTPIDEFEIHVDRMLQHVETERCMLNALYTQLEENMLTAQRAISGYADITEIKTDAINTLSRLKHHIDSSYNAYSDQFSHFTRDISKMNIILKQKEEIEALEEICAKNTLHSEQEMRARDILLHKMEKLQKNMCNIESTHHTLSRVQDLLEQKFEDFIADLNNIKSIAQKRMDYLHNDWVQFRAKHTDHLHTTFTTTGEPTSDTTDGHNTSTRTKQTAERYDDGPQPVACVHTPINASSDRNVAIDSSTTNKGPNTMSLSDVIARLYRKVCELLHLHT